VIDEFLEPLSRPSHRQEAVRRALEQRLPRGRVVLNEEGSSDERNQGFPRSLAVPTGSSSSRARGPLNDERHRVNLCFTPDHRFSGPRLSGQLLDWMYCMPRWHGVSRCLRGFSDDTFAADN